MLLGVNLLKNRELCAVAPQGFATGLPVSTVQYSLT